MIDVYLNKRAMRKNGYRVYSLRDSNVFAHSHYVLMKDVSFVVQPAGRLETIKRLQGKHHKGFAAKTVHAFLRGNVLNYGQRAWINGKELGLLEGDVVNYNPLFMEQFCVQSNDPSLTDNTILQAKFALCHKEHIQIIH